MIRHCFSKEKNFARAYIEAAILNRLSFDAIGKSRYIGPFPRCIPRQRFLREDQTAVRNRVKRSRCLQMHRVDCQTTRNKKIRVRYFSVCIIATPNPLIPLPLAPQAPSSVVRKPRRDICFAGRTFRGVTPPALLRGSNRKSYSFFFSRRETTAYKLANKTSSFRSGLGV